AGLTSRATAATNSSASGVSTSSKRSPSGPRISTPWTVAAISRSASSPFNRHPKQLHRVVHRQLAAGLARVRGYLQRAPRVGRGHRLRSGVQQVLELAAP